jgi:hypothetical protein
MSEIGYTDDGRDRTLTVPPQYSCRDNVIFSYTMENYL